MNHRKIEIFLDAGILLTGFLLLITILSGGFQFNIGDKIVGLRSFKNPLVLFLIFFGIRSLKYGRPFSYLPWKLHGAKGIWLILSAVIGLIVIYLLSMTLLAASNAQPVRTINLQQAKELIPDSSVAINNNGIRLKSDEPYLIEFLLPAGETSGYSKIRFSFDRDAGTGTQNLTGLDVIYENTDGDVIKRLSRVRIVRGVFVYELPLVDKAFDTIHVILKSNTQRVDSRISEITLHSAHVTDYKYFTTALVVLIALLLLLPGLLIVSALSRKNRSATVLLYGLFAASLCYYLVLYGLLELSFLYKLSKPGNLLIVGLLLSIAGLLYMNFRQDRFETLNYYLYSARTPLALFIVILLLLTLYISFDTPYPFQNLGWQSISGPKTFNVFSAHDNYFQFANGRVIAEQLPFSDEYGVWGQTRPLFFYAEDREILPGVIYAVFRSMGNAVSPVVGNSYMSYTIFGVAMNLMIIFPIIALAQRYIDLKSETLVILLVLILFGNGALIAHSSLTWFKFSGAALFLSGLGILLGDRSRLQSWLLGGLCFGLAVNMHAGVALGIPFYFLWLLYQKGKEENYSVFAWLSGPVLLMISFMIINLPWKLVKKFYLHDSISLPTTFLFGGYSKNNSLFDSAILFFQEVPFAEQISFRLQRLLLSLRLDEAGMLWQELTENDFVSFLSYWTHLEFGYTVFLYYPLLLIISLGFILKKIPMPMNLPNVTGMRMAGQGRNKDLG
jgi:hypothetical protein